MFAVFAHTMGEEEVTGRGDTFQDAWENMLGDFSVDEDDIDMDTVQFYQRTVEVTRETKTIWTGWEESDE
jgi:hypothetical protein